MSETGYSETAVLDLLRGECSGRLPEPVQVRKLGLQTAPLGVSEGVPHTRRRSDSRCFRISEMSPTSQIHDLGHGGQGDSSECSGVTVGPGNLAVSPVPLILEVLLIVEEQQIEAVLICLC